MGSFQNPIQYERQDGKPHQVKIFSENGVSFQMRGDDYLRVFFGSHVDPRIIANKQVKLMEGMDASASN